MHTTKGLFRQGLEDEVLKDVDKITKELFEKEYIDTDYYHSSSFETMKIVLNNDELLNKCHSNVLSWLLEHHGNLAFEKIINNPVFLIKLDDPTLALQVSRRGMLLWDLIKKIGRDNFEDPNYFCWAIEGQEEVALDIIKDDEKVLKIFTQATLRYVFFSYEKVVLALIENPIFIQKISPYYLENILVRYESCARALFDRINEIDNLQHLSNVCREKLRNKYPFWKQNDRPLNSSELKSLALDKERLQRAIQKNPQIVNYQDEKKRTIMHYIAGAGLFLSRRNLGEILDIIWETNVVNLEIQDADGNTPLHTVAEWVCERTASNYTMPEFIQAALRFGQRLDITNEAGETAFDVLRSLVERRREFNMTHGYRHPFLSALLSEPVQNASSTAEIDEQLQNAITLSLNHSPYAAGA